MNQPVKPSPLGRGLSALFGDADASYQAKPVAAATPAAKPERGGVMQVPLTWLQPSAFQPRRNFDEDALKGLADSIRQHGVLEPLIVRPIRLPNLDYAKDIYEIVAGERRWRASQKAGLHEVPVIVRDLTQRDAIAFAIIENIQRENLSPLEEAEGYRRLLGPYSQEEIATCVGKSRSHITNMIRILTLPDAVKQMIERGLLTLGHARAIIPVPEDKVVALAQEIVKKGLNVRQAEVLAKRMQENPQIHKRKTAVQDANVAALEKDLERALGLKVKIHAQGSSGTLAIHYRELEQLDGVVKKLKA